MDAPRTWPPTGAPRSNALASHDYDAVLMDCQMPYTGRLPGNSPSCAGANVGSRRIPVIAMTAHAMNGDEQKCLDAGMDGYVTKPMRHEQLLDALLRVLPPDVGGTRAA